MIFTWKVRKLGTGDIKRDLRWPGGSYTSCCYHYAIPPPGSSLLPKLSIKYDTPGSGAQSRLPRGVLDAVRLRIGLSPCLTQANEEKAQVSY